MRTLEQKLKALRVFTKYKANILKQHPMTYAYIMSKNYRDILGSFNWETTPEGFTFWMDINYKIEDDNGTD